MGDRNNTYSYGLNHTAILLNWEIQYQYLRETGDGTGGESLTCPCKRNRVLLGLVILQFLRLTLHHHHILQCARELVRNVRPGERLYRFYKLAKCEGQLGALLCDRLHCLHQSFELGL